MQLLPRTHERPKAKISKVQNNQNPKADSYPCVHKYMYVDMHICPHLYTHTSMHAHVHVYTDIHTHMSMSS